MRNRQDSSLDDLLPWQTPEGNPDAPNFIQSHAATIAKMTSASQHIPHCKSSPNKKPNRIFTTLTCRMRVNTAKSKDLRTSKEEIKSKQIENSSRQKLKNLLYSSLSPQKLKRVMETVEYSSPLRVTQISTEQSSLSAFKNNSIRFNQKYHSDIYLRKVSCPQQQPVPRRVTFADFVEESNKKKRVKKIDKARDRQCQYKYKTIHEKDRQPNQSVWRVKQAFKDAKSPNKPMIEISRTASSKRKLVSSLKLAQSKQLCLPWNSKFNDMGVGIQK